MKSARGLAALLLLVLSLAACRPAAPDARPRGGDPGNAAPQDVSLNRLPLAPPAGDPFSFLVVGHLYGGIGGDDRDPARAFIAKIPEIKKAGFSMLVSLGDVVKQSQEADFAELERQVLRELPFPVFNTVGNHDVEDRALYEMRYGQTFYSFNYGTARMIFLDTERENCAIDEAQWNMAAQALQAASSDDAVQTIFIFMHKTLFFKNDALFQQKNPAAGPNVWDCYGAPGFALQMERDILPAAAKKPVTMFAGDVGATGNLTPYIERHPSLPLTLVMTGLGDTDRDAGIRVTVQGAQVRLESYPLSEAAMPALETYTPEYWLKIGAGK